MKIKNQISMWNEKYWNRSEIKFVLIVQYIRVSGSGLTQRSYDSGKVDNASSD